MKPETAAALNKLDRRQRVEIVNHMLGIMGADEFVEALAHDDKRKKDELSPAGDSVFQELINEYGDHLVDIDDSAHELDLLHEAICEGRAQDALDLLGFVVGNRFRSVEEQNRIFPQRVVTPLFNF